jgi:hypothetical protein
LLGFIYIHLKVSFLIHLADKVVHIECILCMYHNFLQNVMYIFKNEKEM